MFKNIKENIVLVFFVIKQFFMRFSKKRIIPKLPYKHNLLAVKRCIVCNREHLFTKRLKNSYFCESCHVLADNESFYFDKIFEKIILTAIPLHKNKLSGRVFLRCSLFLPINSNKKQVYLLYKTLSFSIKREQHLIYISKKILKAAYDRIS